jgi:hypothetical protein
MRESVFGYAAKSGSGLGPAVWVTGLYNSPRSPNSTRAAGRRDPARTSDPITNRRANLVARLEEQQKLLADPTWVRSTVRFKGKGEAREQYTQIQRVSSWARPTANGFAMVVKAGGKALEFSPGKSAIAVQTKEQLGELISKLIEAAKVGEFDELLAKAVRPFGAKRTAKAKKAA